MKQKRRGMSEPASFCQRMQLKVHSFSNLAQNVHFDDVLFQLAQKHGAGEYLRFWESPVYGIVLGRIGKEEDDIHIDVAAKDNIPIIRRSSGGGTVVQGPGCLNYALVLSKKKRPILDDLRASYQWISEKIIAALKERDIDAVFCPISDLARASDHKKFSGNAQRRAKDFVLHHGTILYGFDLDLIPKYLKIPKDMPQYRNARSHKDFVTNIYINVPEFQLSLAAAFEAEIDPQPLTAQEISFLEKYNI